VAEPGFNTVLGELPEEGILGIGEKLGSQKGGIRILNY